MQGRFDDDGGGAHLALVCRVQQRLCALPLAHVIETMRPLPTTTVAGAPPFVCGLAVIRGAAVPVLDAARLLCDADDEPGRFVMLALGASGTPGSRHVALAVGSVLGVRAIPPASLQALPPLLQDAGADAVASIGLLDAELLLVLQASRLLSDEAWAGLVALRAA